MNFIYTRIKDEIRIDKIENPEAVIYVPEQFEDCPVTELGSYVLAHSAVEEIHLPPYVRKIGAYGFYECEQLKRIYCYSRVLDLGAGLFAGVPAVEYLDITEFPGERSCLKEMLSELRQTLRVQLHQMQAAASEETAVVLGNAAERTAVPGSQDTADENEARLIFPEYYEDSVENTPARIVSIETHGCGHRYRYCFAGRVFQYRGYDELFPHVQVQEKEELVTELALGRLLYPRELSEKFREHYLTYVREHWKTAGKLLIQADRMQRNRVSNLEPGKLPWLVDEVLDEVLDEVKQEQDTETRQSISGIGEETETAEPVNANQTRVDLVDQLGILISFAQEAGDTEMVSWLMERRHRLRTAGAVQDIGGVQTAAVPSADAVQGTDESQFASGNPEISGEPQRPKRKRRFEL